MMNELQNSTIYTPIEIALQVDESGHTTARALYEFLELAQSQFSRWAKSNIENNEFYEENIDWWGFDIVLNGNKCKDYRLTTDFAKHLCMESHSSKGKIARQYFVKIENKAKEFVIDRSQLSPNLQTAYAILESQAKLELEQKKQSKRIEKVETTIGNMKNIFIEPIGDWQNDINTRVREVSYKSGIEFQALYGQLYDELEKVAHCNLKQLQHNRKKRLEKAGNTKAEIIARSAKIAIIHDKPQLKAIFENIVRKYAMIYCS